MNTSKAVPCTLAVLWQRFGAYHFARLRGAAESLASQGWQTVGIEVAGRDEYEWKNVSEERVTRQTIFPDIDYNAVPSAQIRKRVMQTLDSLNADAVAINGWSVPEARAAAAWCRRNNRLAILMSESFESSGKWWKEQLKRRRLRQFDAALVGGRWHADYLAGLGFPRDKIVIGYDAVDNAHFSTVPECSSMNGAKVAELPKRYFFANTRFLPRKNIDGLLEAYRHYRTESERIKPATEPWHLVISGSGEMDGEWKALANRLELSSSVHWPGFLQYEELPLFYANASAFVHVAHREAWGQVVNEAAAAGLPLIIGNRVGAACELVQDGFNGILVDSANVDEISRALLEVATRDDVQRQQMGHASQQIVDAYGPERFGSACVKILTEQFCTP